MVDRPTTPPAKTSLPSLFKNVTSLVGLAIAFSSAAFHVILLVLFVSQENHNPYVSLWFYVVLPPTVVIGFFLAGLGAYLTRRKLRATGTVDTVLFRASGQKILLVVAPIALLLVLPFLGYTSYAGFHYTESDNFCGTACHAPMEPEFVTYQISPHARVGCAECHVGQGITSYLRSKIGGMRQLWHVIDGSYARPIPTPVESLRPAEETCEKCHWPDRPLGTELVRLPRFASDEESTPRPVNMLLQLGRVDPVDRTIVGIHWHTSSSQRVEYVSTDENRLNIPWVRVTRNTPAGEAVKVFRSDGIAGDAPPAGELRTMDCIDCHNRPAHRFQDPETLISNLIDSGRIDRNLPFVMREASLALLEPAEDRANGLAALEERFRSFYRDNHPEIAAEKEGAISRSLAAVQEAYRENVFPEMRVTWDTHPDHSGHKIFPGCFRCHDADHRASDGATIVQDCSACHSFLEETESSGKTEWVQGEFQHPFPLEEAHATLDCTSCHAAGPPPEGSSCQSCHGEVQQLMAGTLDLLPGVKGPPSPKLGLVDCTDCHEGGKRFTREEIAPLCVDCHDDEYGKKAETWLAELDRADSQAREALAARPDSPDTARLRKALGLLERAHPLHNVDFALDVLHRIGGAAVEPDGGKASR